MAAVHEGFHRKHVVTVCGLEDRHGLGMVQGERLFAQDMFARLRGLDRPLGVHRMRRGDIDRLDVFVRQQGLVAAVPAGQVEFVAELVSCFLVPAADGNNPARFGVGNAACKGPGNPSRADNSPCQLLCHRFSSLCPADRIGPAAVASHQGRLSRHIHDHPVVFPAPTAAAASRYDQKPTRMSTGRQRQTVRPSGYARRYRTVYAFVR